MMPTSFLADFGPEMAAIVVPVIIFMIPIVAILTKHQQRMAELIHGSNNAPPNPEMEMLRREVAELKNLVHQQTMMIDELAQQTRALPGGSSAVSGRLEG